MKEKIIIIGTGIAAISAIKSIREIDKDSEIMLFGDEKFYPYNRMRLLKGLTGVLEEEKLLLQKKNWYETNNISLFIDTKVSSVDTEKKQVELLSGNRVDYTKLLLANGASNSMPDISGINKKGVFTVRNLQDAKNIMEAISNRETILTIGGGVLGLELAWVLSQAGKKVIISAVSPRLMTRQLDTRASQILENSVKDNGVELMLNSRIRKISAKEDGVEGFIVDEDNFFKCDVVAYSKGITPNIDIAEGTNIKTNKGIIVNEKMETNVKDVYAAGDVAELSGKVYGLWNIAVGQGTTAGYNIVGKETKYKYIAPVSILNAFGLSLFTMGSVQEKQGTDILVEDTQDSNNYKKLFISDNKIIGAIVIGDTGISPTLKRAIESQLDLGDVDYKSVSIDEIIEIIKNSKH